MSLELSTFTGKFTCGKAAQEANHHYGATRLSNLFKNLNAPAPSRPTYRWAVDTESELVHVALLDLLHAVLVGAVHILAHPILQQVPAHRHAGWVKLVQKTTGIAFHAESSQPVCAHGLQGRTGVVS